MKTFYRIDDRLIHGQVLEGWVHNLSLTRISVVSDRVKEDKQYSGILRFAVPSEMTLDILTLEEYSDRTRRGYTEEEDTIVLFEAIDDVLKLLDHGVRINTLILGCLHSDNATVQLARSIAVNKSDIENMADIDSMGTDIIYQPLPQDKAVPVKLLLECVK